VKGFDSSRPQPCEEGIGILLHHGVEHRILGPMAGVRRGRRRARSSDAVRVAQVGLLHATRQTALGVLQSDLVSVGGVAPIIAHLTERRQVLIVSGLGWWPAKADVDYFRREHRGAIPPSPTSRACFGGSSATTSATRTPVAARAAPRRGGLNFSVVGILDTRPVGR